MYCQHLICSSLIVTFLCKPETIDNFKHWLSVLRQLVGHNLIMSLVGSKIINNFDSEPLLSHNNSKVAIDD